MHLYSITWTHGVSEVVTVAFKPMPWPDCRYFGRRKILKKIIPGDAFTMKMISQIFGHEIFSAYNISPANNRKFIWYRKVSSLFENQYRKCINCKEDNCFIQRFQKEVYKDYIWFKSCLHIYSRRCLKTEANESKYKIKSWYAIWTCALTYPSMCK